MKLNPVRFRFDDRSRYWTAGKDGSIDKTHAPDGSKADTREAIGFTSQNIIAAEKQSGAAATIIADESDADLLRITETRLIPVLVNGLKQLKTEFDAYRAAHP